MGYDLLGTTPINTRLCERQCRSPKGGSTSPVPKCTLCFSQSDICRSFSARASTTIQNTWRKRQVHNICWPTAACSTTHQKQSFHRVDARYRKHPPKTHSHGACKSPSRRLVHSAPTQQQQKGRKYKAQE